MPETISMVKRTTISLKELELRQLKEIAKAEHRPISRQIVHMMEIYKKHYKEK
jgi:hypothetical protein